jgi:hypothetical protein
MKKKFLTTLVVLSMTFGGIPAHAETPFNPILVVDKCPEFCPPTNWRVIKPPKRVCAQVLIPVSGKRGWFWTDSCKTKMIKVPKSGNR